MSPRRPDNEEVLEEGDGPSLSSSTVSWLKSLIILTVLIAYLFAGAAVFHALEQPPSRRAAQQFKEALLKLAEENACMDDTAVNDLMDIVTRAIGEGAYNFDNLYATKLESENDSYVEGTWTIGNSFMFSFTVVTTIGYGNLAPRTKPGEFFCVIYAVFGLPQVASLLFTISEILQYLYSRHSQAINKLCRCLILLYPRVKKLLLIVNGIVIAYVVLALLPSVIFVYTQGWSFVESHYYSVIALSTIGLGDLVPDFEGLIIQLTFLIKCLMYMYFFICLGMISMILNIVSRKQARVAISMTRTVEQSAFWIRLQHQFQKNKRTDEEGDEQNIPTSLSADAVPQRKLSASERWSKIRMSVDHNEYTREALQRIRRRSEESRKQSCVEEEESETEL